MSKGFLSRHWMWLWVICTVALLNQLVMNLARPVTTYKLIALGFDEFVIGLVAASYAVLPLVVALPLGRRIDKTGNIKHIVSSGLFISAIGGAMLLLNGLVPIFAGYTLLGLGQMVFAIAGQAAVARHTATPYLDAGFGWLTAAFSAGQLIGPLVAGFFLGSEQNLARDILLQRADAALVCSLIITLVAVPIIYLPVKWAKTTVAPVTPDESKQKVTVMSIVRLPRALSHLVAALALLAIIDILTAFLPLVGEELGVSPQWVAVLLSLRAGASLASRFMLAMLSRHFKREYLLISALLISAIGVTAATYTMSYQWLSAILMLIGGFFMGLGQPITLSLMTQAVPPHWRSSALAVRLLGNRVGQLVLPIAAGAVASSAGPAAAIVLSCVLLAGSGIEKTIRLSRSND